MFGLRKRVKKCEAKLKDLECERSGGHIWRYLCRGTNSWPFTFYCYKCGRKWLYDSDELLPVMRRELEYLGILAPVKPKAKKGGKK